MFFFVLDYVMTYEKENFKVDNRYFIDTFNSVRDIVDLALCAGSAGLCGQKDDWHIVGNYRYANPDRQVASGIPF